MMLRSYKCSIDGEYWTTINATSSGKAKSEYYREVADFAPYTLVKCRVNSTKPSNTEGFELMTKYRQIEFAHCGMVVKVGDNKGIIVGHNSSSNLNVLFTEGEFKGKTLNCHPQWKITYYDSNGNRFKKW